MTESPLASSLQEWLRQRKEASFDGLQAQADLPAEIFGISAPVDRPALPVRQGGFDVPGGAWEEFLFQHRHWIEYACNSVGQVLIRGGENARYVGTAFVIEGNTVVTNRHVVQRFMRQDGGSWIPRIGYGRAYRAYVSFADALAESSTGDEVEISGVLFDGAGMSGSVIDDVVVCDLAAPAHRDALALGSATPAGSNVVCIGVPSNAEPDPGAARDEMLRIFGRRYGRKHVSPGVLSSTPYGYSHHDCSTTVGYSGSPLLDPASGQLLGVHAGGATSFNVAVRIETLLAALDA